MLGMIFFVRRCHQWLFFSDSTNELTVRKLGTKTNQKMLFVFNGSSKENEAIQSEFGSNSPEKQFNPCGQFLNEEVSIQKSSFPRNKCLLLANVLINSNARMPSNVKCSQRMTAALSGTLCFSALIL